MIDIKKRKFKMNKWILFIIASALISAGAGFAEYKIIPLAVFFFITGLGTLMTVMTIAINDME